MRDARLVGPSGDGQWLIIEGDGEHLRLPMDDALRAAVRREMQMPMPLQTGVSPREVQGRIRAGETAAQIAESCGVAVELIARFEGPVLDERRWQAERARRTVVGGTSLQERFAAAVDEADGSPGTTWDAWVDREDGGWRVTASCADGRSAVWSWDTQTTKLRGQNDLGRFALSGRVVSDDLEAVLRPLASRPAPTPAPPREPQRIADPDPDADRPRTGAKRRTSVPSWDEILLGSNPRPPAGEPPD